MGWLAGWSYRKKLTIDHTKFSADRTNVPIPVQLDTLNFDFSKISENGEDFRFTTNDGTTVLPHEIEDLIRESSGSGLGDDSASAHNFYAVDGANVNADDSKIGDSSLALDGTGDYLYSDDSPDWDSGSNDFCIECWVKVSSIKANTICARVSSGSSYFYFTMEGGSEGNVPLRFRDYPGGVDFTRWIAVYTGVWYHIAITRNGSDWRMFLDGVQQGATYSNAAAMADRAVSLDIGHMTANSGYALNGRIDEFRLSVGDARYTSNFTPQTTPFTPDAYTKLLMHYEIVLGDVNKAVLFTKVPNISSSVDTDIYLYYGNDLASDIQDPVTLWSDYTAVWHMNQIPAGTVGEIVDSTGNGHDAQGQGTLPVTADGLLGNGIKGQGASSYLRAPDDDALDLTADFEISWKMRWVSSVSNGSIFGKSQGGGGQPKWIINYGNLVGGAMAFHGGGSTVSWAWSPSADTWYNCVIKRSGNDWKFFVNGSQVGSTVTSAITVPNTTQYFVFFGDGEGWQWFSGRLDEVRLLNGSIFADGRALEDYYACTDQALTYGTEETMGGSHDTIQLSPSLGWLTYGSPHLTPALQFKTIKLEHLSPALQWKTSAAVKYLPNIVNYPFYFSAPTVQTSEVPLLVSGCPVGFSVHMKDTGSSGQTTIKVYAGGTLRATKTIAASGVSDSYIEYFDLDSVLHPLETFSVEITEVATGAEDLKVNMYLMTFPYKLEEMYYENYFGSQLIHGISSNYLFKSADYWSIEFNQPIGTIISVKAVKDGVEEDVSYEVIDGIYYNNRLKITPSTTLPDTLRIILQDVKSDKYTFELTPEFKEYSVTIPDYVTARLASESYGSDLATGGTASADSEVGGFEASKAFDDNTGTYWNSTTPVANIAYEFPTVKQIQKITIKPYMYGGHSTVKRWILCGSNDATPALDDEDAWSYISGGLVEDSSDTQAFTFTNEYTYKHYRLTVLDNWASTAYTGIYELAMFERSVTFDAVQQFYAYLPLKYYQYSHDGGSTWSDLAAFDSNYLDIDFAGLDSGLRTVKVRLFQTQDYFEDEFQVNYVGGELDCYVEFDGSTFQFFYTDEIPFGSLTLYVDDVLNSSISPVMVDGFDTGSFDELSTMTVSDGRFYYQGHVYKWTEDDIDISTLEVEDGENIIVFGFNTNTLEFEVKARLETVQYADFIPIMEGKIVVNYQQFTQITQNPTYVFEPDDYPLDFDEDVSLRVVFEDVTGRTKEFEFDYIKTFYNVWRTLTVTDSEGNEILPGQIHSETTLTYTVTTDEG